MTDVDWNPEEEAPPRKRRVVPKWIWAGCGCGCLVTVLVVAIGAWFLRQALDPEVQWPKLRAVLPYEERPSDLKMTMGMPAPGLDVFVLQDLEDGYQAQVTYASSLDPAARKQLFSGDGTNVAFGFGQPDDVEELEYELQGETVPALRFEGIKGTRKFDQLGQGIRFDVGTGKSFRLVELRQIGRKGPVTEEQIADFFDHFQLWETGGSDDEPR